MIAALRSSRPLRAVASLRLTLAALVVLTVAVWFLLDHDGPAWPVLVPPLAVLAANLVAAVITHPAFRRWNALLIFHLGLIAIVVLAAIGQLTYLKGHVELTEGQEFGGALTETDAGPLHRSMLDDVRFVNEGFALTYAPGLQRNATRNKVRYADADGRERSATVGDQVPLVLKGYRFYTSHNKGFAPIFLWQPKAGEPALGAVHLPSYPALEHQQARDWILPGTRMQIWTMLKFDETLLDPEGHSTFRLPGRHTVIVRIGGERREMAPGDVLDLPEGRLHYDGLRTWMGYAVFYDWTIHWMLIAAMLTVAALGWHFWRRFAARPWNPDGDRMPSPSPVDRIPSPGQGEG